MDIYLEKYPELKTFTLGKLIDHYNRYGKIENRILPPSKKITLITPCSRPENIPVILESINFEYIHEWIIVYDGMKVNGLLHLENPKIKEYIFTDPESIKGTSQRNFAMNLVNDGYIYFLDDDNIVHPKLYILLHFIKDGHFYTYNQQRQRKILLGNKLKEYKIDTAMLLIDISLTKNILWENNLTHDGEYISKIYKIHPEKWIWINSILSYYNKLT